MATRKSPRERVDALLLEGLNSGPATPLVAADWEATNRKLEEREAARREGDGRDGRKPKADTSLAADRRPRSRKLTALLRSVLDHPEEWMATPNVWFGDRRPADLVGTDEEIKIFDVLNAVDQGLF